MTDSTLAATWFLLWSGFLYWLRWWLMMLVGVDSGVSLWMLVKRAPRLAKMPASRSRQTAQATPKGLLRLPRTSVCLRDQGLVCWMTRLSMPNDEVRQESFFTRLLPKSLFYELLQKSLSYLVRQESLFLCCTGLVLRLISREIETGAPGSH